MENIKQILIATREANNLTQQQMADLLGVSRSAYNYYEAGRNNPKAEFCKAFQEKFKIDLLQSDVTNVPHVLTDTSPSYGKMKQQKAKPVPYFNVDVTAGAVDIFNDSPEDVKQYISIPQFGDAEMYVNVYGDSMYKTFPSGCIVALKKITDYDVVEYGKHYVVVTAERRMIKQIRKGELGFFKLVSEHKEHDEFEVLKAKVVRLYLVLGKISKDVM